MGFAKSETGSAGTSAAEILKRRRQGVGWNVKAIGGFAVRFTSVSLFVAFLASVWQNMGFDTDWASSNVASDLFTQQRLSVGWRPSLELRWHLACNERCVGKTTKSDESIANLLRGVREATGEVIKNWTLFVEDMCVQSCLADYRKGTTALVESDNAEVALPPEVQEYITCASSCREALVTEVSKGGMSADAAGKMLRKCGVVHVQLSPASDAGAKLLQSLQQGYEQVRSGTLGPGLGDLVDRVSPPLRNGREEVWLPYAAPFTSFTDIFSMGPIGDVVAHYFNHSAVVVDHVNLVNAPAKGVATRQGIHTDIKKVSEHLELHLPLLPEGLVPLEMGPTRFCPCMHGLVDSGSSAKRSIRQYFGDNGTCLQFEELSWTLHADPGVRPGPWATLYDADVHHQGLENVSPKDRPVFVVALAASHASVQERGYSDGRMISEVHAEAVARFRGVDLDIPARQPRSAES